MPKPIDLQKLAAMLEKYLHLEWIYDDTRGESVVPGNSEQVVAPPSEELEVLRDLALRGDMNLLSQRSRHIEELGERYVPFAHKLKSLAQKFQENAIRDLLTTQSQDPSESGDR